MRSLPSARQSLFLGSASGGFQSIAGFILVGVGLPIFLASLGNERYGLFAVVSVFSTVGNVASTGLNGALIHYVGFAETRQAANRAIWGNIVIAATVGVSVLLVGWILEVVVLESLVGLTPITALEAILLYRLVLISSVALTVGQSFVALLDIQQKNYVANLLQFLYTVCYWVLLVGAVVIWRSLEAVGWAMVVSAYAWLLAVLGFALKSWGALDFGGITLDLWRSVQNQLRYGGQLFVAGQLGWFYEPLSKILMANGYGVEMVGLFDIALRVKTQIWALFWRLIYPINPYLASHHGGESVKFVVLETSRMILVVIPPVCIALAILLQGGIPLWLNVTSQYLAVSTIVMTGGHLLALVGLPMYHYLIASGGARLIIVVHAINAIGNIVLVLSLGQTLGFYVFPIGNALASILSSVFLLTLQRFGFGTLFPDTSYITTRVSVVMITCIGFGLILTAINKSPYVMVIVYPILIVGTSLILYRALGAFRSEQMRRLLGDTSRVAEVIIRFLTKN